MFTRLLKLHSELYKEVDEITKRHTHLCKIRHLKTDSGHNIDYCYGKPIVRRKVAKMVHNENMTCCTTCGHLKENGCSIQNIACRVHFCMPVIKKIQRTHINDFCILTAFKTVFKDGHFMPPDVEVVAWFIMLEYFEPLHFQYKTRVAQNPIEKIIIDKVVEITGELLREIYAVANGIPNFSIEKLVLAHEDRFKELEDMTPKEV